MKTKTLLAAVAAALALATSAGAQNAPPALNVTLAPHQSDGAVDKVGVTLKLQAPGAQPGEPFLRLPMVFASVETQRYEAAQIEVTDAKGAVPLVQKDDPVDQANFMYFRRWQVARPTQGDVTVRYTANAAAFRPKLGSGPPFDLRPEAGGLNGAGVTFLALPDNSRPYSLSLDWDLAAMPAGSRGAQSLGEGQLKLVGPVDLLAHTFYMAGPMNSYPEASSGQPFAIYWLGTPPFDVPAVASWTEKARTAIATFFGEPNKPYRVFFRHNPYPGTGGAGLINSFMSGFGDDPRSRQTQAEAGRDLADRPRAPRLPRRDRPHRPHGCSADRRPSRRTDARRLVLPALRRGPRTTSPRHPRRRLQRERHPNPHPRRRRRRERLAPRRHQNRRRRPHRRHPTGGRADHHRVAR